jgi:hypothetical protein
MDAGVAGAETARRRIVVTSIGAAGPVAAAAVARGLGVSVAQAVACFYRAPSVLAEGVAAETAEAIVRLLRDIGFAAHAAPQEAAAPPPARLFDVALHIAEPRAVHAAADALAAFVGATRDAALEMILVPPGLALGAVSAATVEAFRARLPAGVEAVAARPEDSTYGLFLLDGPAVVRARLMLDLAPLGVAPDAAPGLIATGVAHDTVQRLWRRHQAGGMLRAVNAAFLRYDVVATGLAGADPADPALAETLAALTGMPAELAPRALAELPLTMIEGAPHDAVAGHLAALAALGLDAHAELTTFQRLGIEVTAAADPAALKAVLAGFGLPAVAPPFRLETPVPELQARILRAALEDAGADVRFTTAAP